MRGRHRQAVRTNVTHAQGRPNNRIQHHRQLGARSRRCARRSYRVRTGREVDGGGSNRGGGG
jgi:hypothetical protein